MTGHFSRYDVDWVMFNPDPHKNKRYTLLQYVWLGSNLTLRVGSASVRIGNFRQDKKLFCTAFVYTGASGIADFGVVLAKFGHIYFHLVFCARRKRKESARNFVVVLAKFGHIYFYYLVFCMRRKHEESARKAQIKRKESAKKAQRKHKESAKKARTPQDLKKCEH
eukprot:97560-Ditylum_brightwellii.AAC.1